MSILERPNYLLASSDLHRLRPTPAAFQRGYVRLTLARDDATLEDLFLPVGADLDYLVAPRRKGAPLRAMVDDAVIEPVALGDRLVAQARQNFTSLRHSLLHFGDVAIFPEGPKDKTRPYRKALSAARHSGLAFDSAYVTAHPELFRGWTDRAAFDDAPADQLYRRVAVVLHLHYVELWDEIEKLLRAWPFGFALFVTLTRADDDIAARVRAAFPGADVRVVDNRGRDVRPFLSLLEEGAFEGYDAVCKIHGKRSLGGGRLPIFGDMMRRVAFVDLIANPRRVQALVRRFEENPDLGIVGSPHFHARPRAARRDIIGPVNRAAVDDLATRLGAPVDDARFDFFEGTMFWVRPAALRELAALRLSREFAEEAGRLDGALEHAVERIFNHAVKAAGYQVEATSV